MDCFHDGLLALLLIIEGEGEERGGGGGGSLWITYNANKAEYRN